MYNMVIEQTADYQKRTKYNPENGTFYETLHVSLFYVRGVTFPYGWLKESGTPPNDHLDVILMSGEHFELGDELPIKIIGVFKRNDCDHKLVAVSTERTVNNFSELPEDEKNEVFKLYPRIDPGEGWFGADIADEVINDYYINGRNRS